MTEAFSRALWAGGLLAAACVAVSPPAGAAVIGKDNRQTFAEYAQRHRTSLLAMRRRFGASGLLECPGRLASAQVVGSRWTVLTNAHNLLDRDGELPWSLDTCVLIMTGLDGRRIDYRVSAANWQLGTRRPARNRYQDWAVLTLEAPVPESVEPYRVESPSRRPIPRRAPITVVAASHDNWPGRSRRVASIEDCRLRGIRVRINGRRNLLGFDCDTGRGASGAALLDRASSGYRLIGLGVGERNRRRGAAYDGSLHFNAAIPIHARLYRAIEAMARAAGRNARAPAATEH